MGRLPAIDPKVHLNLRIPSSVMAVLQQEAGNIGLSPGMFVQYRLIELYGNTCMHPVTEKSIDEGGNEKLASVTSLLPRIKR